MKEIGFSLEIFPPKKDDGIEKIYAPLEGLKSVSPDFISVTYSAGGSADGLTAEVCQCVRDKCNVPSVAHLTCAGSSREKIKTFLADLRNKKVDRVLALRGDLNDQKVLSDYQYATDLIPEIVENGFSVLAACYPEGHKESKSFADDIAVMKKKEDLGASRFLSQLFFDEKDFLHMVDEARKAGVRSPIEAGIMPVTNAKQIVRMVQLSGARIPKKLAKLISKYEQDPEGLRLAGIEYAVEMSRALVKNGVDGLHLYAMNNVPNTLLYYDGVRAEIGR